jgi:hypothetical protein
MDGRLPRIPLQTAATGRHPVRDWKAWLCVLAVCLTFQPSPTSAQVQEPPSVSLAVGQEKVLFIPIQGSSEDIQEVREREAQSIQRVMHSHGLAVATALTPYSAPEFYLQVEPHLLLAHKAEVCARQELSSVPAELLKRGIAEWRAGRMDDARQALEAARAALPCAQNRLTRPQLAELLLWSGLSEPDPDAPQARAFLRGALATDPLLLESPGLPSDRMALLQRVLFEVEKSLEPVAMRLPQGEGEAWSMKNLSLDGRRLVFDKNFIQLMPGMHYVQITLADESTYGALVEVAAGKSTDLARLTRERMGLLTRFDAEFSKILSEGTLSPSLEQGLKDYCRLLQRPQVYLAAMSKESDGIWLTLRRFHQEKGLELVLTDRKAGNAPTASTPVKLSMPWAIDAQLQAANILQPSLDYRSLGVGLELDAWFSPAKFLRLGGFVFGGVRSYRLANADDKPILVADSELVAGASVSTVVPLGSRLSLVPDVGYLQPFTAWRGLKAYCDPVYTTSEEGSHPIYSCDLDSTAVENSLVFNMRAMAGGPRIRLGMEFRPFSRDTFTLRAMARIGYSPLLIRFNELSEVITTVTDDAGNTITEVVYVSLPEDERAFILHRLDFSLGINGTY